MQDFHRKLRRRAFLGLAAGAAIPESALSSTLEDTLNPAFTTSIKAFPQNYLQALSASESSFYSLHRDIGSTHSYRLSRLTLDGKATWSKNLRAGVFYTGICAAASGEGLAFGMEPAVRRLSAAGFRSDGAEMGPFDLGSEPLVSSCLVGQTLVAYQANGDVRVQNLSTGAVQIMPAVLRAQEIASGHTPPYLKTSLEASGGDRCLLIDHTLGRLVLLNLSDRGAEASRLSDPSLETGLQRSREFLATVVPASAPAAAAPGQRPTPATPTILAATASDGRGGVFGLVSPLNQQRALVLQFSPDGSVQRRFRCGLPDRSAEKFKAPFHMAFASGTLLLALQDSMVGGYVLG